MLYLDEGRWKEAEELLVQVMEMRNKVLGEEHLDTLTSMSNLASNYRYKDRWDDAEKLEIQVMEIRKAKLGADHPNTLTSMTDLAFTWKTQGRSA
ncbi:hypothetical protein yc1106_01637 [Curvularia clavata]|uniref:Kinesin light chain n=1 Tax=Curvularia clavata TaxID=95742 RepID=A0A9Q9DNU0_CURCL|nr:hypothetical protein yc1106_01637 [Curvularia clavata]